MGNDKHTSKKLSVVKHSNKRPASRSPQRQPLLTAVTRSKLNDTFATLLSKNKKVRKLSEPKVGVITPVNIVPATSALLIPTTSVISTATTSVLSTTTASVVTAQSSAASCLPSTSRVLTTSATSNSGRKMLPSLIPKAFNASSSDQHYRLHWSRAALLARKTPLTMVPEFNGGERRDLRRHPDYLGKHTSKQLPATVHINGMKRHSKPDVL